MANYWKFTNKNGGPAPEIELMANEAADRILLHNILNGHYGAPTITEGDQREGMASRIVIEFGVPPVVPEEPENPDNPENPDAPTDDDPTGEEPGGGEPGGGEPEIPGDGEVIP